MYIVNAPMMFTGIWAMIKPWVDEKTRLKIHIKKNPKELLDHVTLINLWNYILLFFL